MDELLDNKQNEIVVKNDFTVIPAALIEDLRISAVGVRIYCYLANKTGFRKFYNSDIMNAIGIKDRHTIAKCFKDLVDAGWIKRQEIKNNGMFAGYRYEINIIASGCAAEKQTVSAVCEKTTHGEKIFKDCEKSLKNQCVDRVRKNHTRCENKEQEKERNKEKEEETLLINININNNKKNNNKLSDNMSKNKKTAKKNGESPTIQAKDAIDLEFVRFLEYRKKIKKAYKTDESLGMIYKKFRKWCNGDVSVAKQIVDRTIENGWIGLFEPKKQQHSNRFSFNTAGSSQYDLGVKA